MCFTGMWEADERLGFSWVTLTTKLGAEFGGLSCWAPEQGWLPCQEVSLPLLPAQLSGAVQAVCSLEVTAEAGPWGWWNEHLAGLPQECWWLETALQPSGCAPLRLGRLGGCLSLGGIMSSECNASAYE